LKNIRQISYNTLILELIMINS